MFQAFDSLAIIALFVTPVLTSRIAIQGFEPKEERTSVLEFDPSGLPKCEAGAWSEWTPHSRPPAELEATVQAMSKAYRSGELPVALAKIFDGLRLTPEYPPLLHQGGVIYFKLHRYGNARELFERFLRVAPNRIGQTRALGHCYYTLGDYSRAREHYSAVLKVSPQMVEARRGYALSLLRDGEVDAALKELLRVVELQPDHADAWSWIAQVHFDEDQMEPARSALSKSLELDSFAPRSWFLKSQIEWEAGNDEAGDQAHEQFRRLDRVSQQARALEARLALNPHQVIVLRKLIALHRSVENRPAVREASARLLREEPKNLATRIEVLDLLIEMEDRAAAQTCALSLEEIAGESAQAWKRLEQYWNAVGNRRKRTEAAERYLRLRYR